MLKLKLQRVSLFKILLTPNQRTSNTSNCPTCSNLRIEQGFNDLQTLYPALAAEANGWDPKEIGGGSSKRLSWKCREKGHVWESTIINRTSNGSNCPVCVGQLVVVGVNDLATTHPEVAKQAIDWDPKTLTAGSKKKRSWLCAKGHNYLAPVVNKTNLDAGCPICGNVQILVGYNDLATTHPDLAKEADGWDPSTVVAGTSQKKAWKCDLGHRYSAAVTSRSSQTRQSGCPICDGKVVLAGFNDIATTHPYLANEAVGWDPTTVMAGSSRKKLKWKCQEGHVWETHPNSRLAGHGCPSCSATGFDPNKEGWLYFLEHDDWELLQIGITNVPDNRLKKHRKLGWRVLELRGPMDGLITQNWETDILRMLKAKGAKLSPGEVAGKFDGYSESWIRSTYPAKSLKELMEVVRSED